MIRCADPIPYQPTSKSQIIETDAYICSILPTLTPPDVLLNEPLLVEVFGAGFIKSPGSKQYELRFPRLVKAHRPSERFWTTCITLPELHVLAREAVGRDRADKDVSDALNVMWGAPTSPAVQSEARKRQREEVWRKRLAEADASMARKKRKGPSALSDGPGSPTPSPLRSHPQSPFHSPSRRTGAIRRFHDNESASKSPITTNRQGLRALGSVTNIRSADQVRLPVMDDELMEFEPSPMGDRTVTQEKIATSLKSQHVLSTPPVLSPDPSLRLMWALKPERKEGPSQVTSSTFSNKLSGFAMHTGLIKATSPLTRISTSKDVVSWGSNFSQFLDKALVYYPSSNFARRPAWRPAVKTLLPPGTRVYGFEAFLIGCGWSDAPMGDSLAHLDKGVVFVDPDDKSEYVQKLLHQLDKRRKDAGARRHKHVPLVLVNERLLAYENQDKAEDPQAFVLAVLE